MIIDEDGGIDKMSGITDVKQANIIDSDKISKWKLKIFGIGSIGSNLIKQAALTGFKDIVGYDMDTVEHENIGSQEFTIQHIDMKKTDAIQKLMKDCYDYDISVIDGEITKDTEILPEANTIFFCAFDSLEARNMLWDKLKQFPIVWGESRIGRTAQRYYFVDLRDQSEKNKEWIDRYQESLDPKGPRTELKCGEKGCYSSNSELVGRILRQLVNIAEEKEIATQYIGDWGMPPSIFVMPEQEVPSEIKYD